jgi:hypothetical protein
MYLNAFPTSRYTLIACLILFYCGGVRPSALLLRLQMDPFYQPLIIEDRRGHLMELELRGETGVLWGNLSQCQFVHHKSNRNWPEIEPGPSRWAADHQPPERRRRRLIYPPTYVFSHLPHSLFVLTLKGIIYLKVTLLSLSSQGSWERWGV